MQPRRAICGDEVVFSRRICSNLTPNRLTEAVRQRRNERQPIIDLTESNPTRAGIEYPHDLLAPLANPRGLLYAPQPLGLIAARRAIAGEYRRRDLSLDPERVVLTASTSEAYSLLFKLLAGPGDDVLVPRPSYPLFEHLTALDLVVARPFDLEYHGSWSIDLSSLEGGIGPRTRAVLLVNPNNPTGSFVSSAELDRIASTCARHGVALIVDEVFADYELEPGAARSSGMALARTDALVFALGGLSKSIGLPQIKLGWLVAAGPQGLVTEALERLELICDSYLSISTPVQFAVAELLERGAAIREQIARRIVLNYRSLQALGASVPSCQVLTAKGGWYAVVRVPTLRSEEDLAIELVTRDGVLVHPGYFFDFSRESFLVVSLLPAEGSFMTGIERVFQRAAGEAIQ
jgi:aspartate/methionine/tyrosine aminotransferase